VVSLKLVNVVWLCKLLTKKFHHKYFVKVAENSVYNVDDGWLCDCGHWTSGDDNFHVSIKKEKRDFFEEIIL